MIAQSWGKLQVQQSKEVMERYSEAVLEAELKKELDHARQTLREKDSIISVLTKNRK